MTKAQLANRWNTTVDRVDYLCRTGKLKTRWFFFIDEYSARRYEEDRTYYIKKVIRVVR